MPLFGQNPASPGYGAARDENEVARRLRDLERAIQTVFADGTLRALVDALPAQVQALVLSAIATSVSTGTLTVSGNATVAGRVTGATGMSSVGVYNQLLTYGGLYNSQYVHQDGTMGYVPSSRRYKQEIEPYSVDLETLRKLRVVQFRYIAAVENMGNDAAVEVGMIAEEVHDLGIYWMVDYDAEGNVVGLKRELFGLLALMWVQALDAHLLSQPQ